MEDGTYSNMIYTFMPVLCMVYTVLYESQTIWDHSC